MQRTLGPSAAGRPGHPAIANRLMSPGYAQHRTPMPLRVPSRGCLQHTEAVCPACLECGAFILCPPLCCFRLSSPCLAWMVSNSIKVAAHRALTCSRLAQMRLLGKQLEGAGHPVRRPAGSSPWGHLSQRWLCYHQGKRHQEAHPLSAFPLHTHSQ